MRNGRWLQGGGSREQLTKDVRRLRGRRTVVEVVEVDVVKVDVVKVDVVKVVEMVEMAEIVEVVGGRVSTGCR